MITLKKRKKKILRVNNFIKPEITKEKIFGIIWRDKMLNRQKCELSVCSIQCNMDKKMTLFIEVWTSTNAVSIKMWNYYSKHEKQCR